MKQRTKKTWKSIDGGEKFYQKLAQLPALHH
jgi:hypothetical protein